MKRAMEFPAGASAGASQFGAQGGARGVELEGDSPELIAFVLLKNIVQLEQSKQNAAVFDKAWLLDTYSECLDAVQGRRTAPAPARAAAPRAPAPATAAKRRGKA